MRCGRKQLLATSVRAGLCVAALVLAFRGVALHDSLILRAGPTLKGTVTESATTFHVQPLHGAARVVARTDLAVDARGALQVDYGLLSVWRGSDKALICLGMAVFLFVPLLQAARLKLMLAAMQIALGWRESVRLAFAGNFLNFAAPLGSTAGDLYKAWYAAQRTRRKMEAAATVLLDRAMGLATLLLTVGLIAALSGPESRLGLVRTYVLGLCAVLLLGTAAFLAVPRFWERSLASRFPRLSALLRIELTLRTLLTRKRILLGATGLTLLLQTLAALSFVCVATGLGLRCGEATSLNLYAWFSAGEIVKAIPGPPQGIGTMELAYNYFFAGLGSASQIVSAALAVRLVNLLCALPGVAMVAKLASRPCAEAPASDLRRWPVSACVRAN